MAQPESFAAAPELPPYWRAARFEDEVASRRAYVRITSALLDYRRIDISFTRMLLETGYHVAIVGAPPRAAVGRAISRELVPGIPVTLAPYLLIELWLRHRSVSDFSPWLERHWLHL